jgi:hypothetical protein
MKQAAILIILATAAAVDAKPFKFESKTRYAEVDFAYSREAAAVPALVKRFQADLARERRRTVACGKAETKVRVDSGGEAIACSSSTAITTSGQTSRLLSLARAYYAFTGGAHGNGATTPLLWDRRSSREIRFESLFATADGYSAPLRDRYCRALNAERRKRRGPDYQPSSMVPEFDSCPKFSELSLIPAGSPRFNTINLIAAPYTAGPYAEGDYDIALPVTARLVAALKPQYRSSFEVQRQ